MIKDFQRKPGALVGHNGWIDGYLLGNGLILKELVQNWNHEQTEKRKWIDFPSFTDTT